MPPSSTVESGINNLIGLIFEVAFMYLEAAAEFERRNLPGLCSWMRNQSRDEWQHATKLTAFLREKGAAAPIPPLNADPLELPSPLLVLMRILKEEQKVTTETEVLCAQTLAEHDVVSQAVLTWFATAHLDKQDRLERLLQQVRIVGSRDPGLRSLDGEVQFTLASRVLSEDPTETASQDT